MGFKGLFIGVDRYESSEAPWLNCAVRDAKALHALFTDTLGGETRLLVNEAAKKSEITTELEKLTQCNIDDTVFISFSGHGSEDHNLVPHDYSSADLENTAISLESLQGWFERIPAKSVILILDCCFSGGLGAKVLKVDLKARMAKSTSTLLDQLSGNGRIILTASGAEESAWESQKAGHGLLTHFFIEALYGAEEACSNGKISILKLLEYVSKRVINAADLYGHAQNPTLRGSIDTNISWPIFRKGDLFEEYFPESRNFSAENNLKSLELFGFPRSFIEVWTSRIPTLNSLQLTAINQYKVLEGRHLVVSAPTSSGKTMIGELASLKSVLDGKKALFLLPLKALVNDKYRQFSEMYGPLGMKTIEATGESDNISPLLKGQYDIALLTYEKFLAVMLSNPHVLEQAGVVVIDEVQMIADKSRGGNLEFLLTLLRMRRSEGIEPQTIALSAVIGSTNGLEGWLDAGLLRVIERPVPLDEGVMSSVGNFKFLSSDNQEEKIIQQLINPIYSGKKSSQNIVIPLVQKIVQDGGQVIVFREITGETIGCANYLAENIRLDPATIALSLLPQGDPSSASMSLKDCLKRGTAFHNSHLDREERQAIENSFLSGELKIIVATTTLAMGINTPASAVIIVGLDHPDGPYSIAEYKNMVGRAGRLGFAERGTSYLIPKESRNEQHYWTYYVKGYAEDIQSKFLTQDADPKSLILRVISLMQKRSPLGASSESVVKFLEFSFGAFQEKRIRGSYSYDNNTLQLALNDLERHGLVITTSEQFLQLTELGLLAGESAVSVNSIIRFIDILNSLNEGDINDLTLILISQVSEELDRVNIPLHARSVQERMKWPAELHAQGVSSKVTSLMARNAVDQVTVTSRLKKSMAAIAYIGDSNIENIEAFLCTHMPQRPMAGPIRQVAERTCDVLPTVARIANYIYPNNNFFNNFDLLLARLATGANADMAYLAINIGTKLTRANYFELSKAGIINLDALESADEIIFTQCLRQDRIKIAAIHKAILALRAQKISQSSSISLAPHRSAN